MRDFEEDLFGDGGEADASQGYAQDGPDLFGLEPDEVIVTHEPDSLVPIEDPEPDEVPIDPEDPDAITGVEPEPAEADAPEDEPTAGEAVEEPAITLPPAERRPRPERRDAPLALYRRYRPDTFADVIGQDHVTDPLRRALLNNRVNHAYLFSGPRGCGKTTSARILARCLNCEQGPTPEPCGVCASCRDLARGGTGSIDVIEIDAASHGGVNEARDLRERAFFAPVHSRYKIYIVDEAHMVTKEGFNALLKLVEEPPPHVKFIFATTEPEKVLGTIRSRTHHYPFRLVPPKTLSVYLESLCAAEGVEVDRAVLPLVVRAGAGSVRDSLSVLDQLLGAAGSGGVSYQQAAALLGYTPDTLLDEIVDAFAAGDSAGVFAAIDRVIEVGQDPRRFAEDLLRRLRDLIIVAAVPEALTSGLVDVAADQAERMTVQARGLGAGELTRAAEVIAKGLTDMRGTTAPRLHLELMCARVLLPGADVDARGIHARLDRLERRLQLADSGTGAPDRPLAPVPGPAVVSGEAPVGPAPLRAVPAPEPVVEEPRPAARPQRPEPGPAGSDRPVPHRPGPSPAAVPPAERPDQTAPAAPPRATGGHDPATLTTADVRRMWPQVLDAVKGRRRVTWIVLSQNAQVHSFIDGTLTLALNSGGAKESFGRGGSPEILRDSLNQVLGIAPTIEAIVAGGDPVPGGPVAPAPPATPRSAEPEAPVEPERLMRRRPDRGPAPSAYTPEPPPEDDEDRPNFADLARGNIRPLQVGGQASEPEEEPDRDDPDLDEAGLGVDDLLRKELGAELIVDPEG